MINKMDKYTIINLKKNGMSFRKIAHQLSIDRRTVASIWNAYEQAQEEIILSNNESSVDDSIVDMAIGNIKYDVSNRKKEN